MRSFETGIVPLLRVTWVDEVIYSRSVAALLASGNRQISLVDWSSFAIMRLQGVSTAFTFDPHFCNQGFRVIPEG